MSEIVFSLPYPDAKLSPNRTKGAHWAVVSKARKQARVEAAVLTKQSVAFTPVSGLRPIPIKVTFHPPDKRKRDRDNMISAFKSYADGIADAIGVDDADWEPTYTTGDVIKGGCVVVTIPEAA